MVDLLALHLGCSLPLPRGGWGRGRRLEGRDCVLVHRRLDRREGLRWEGLGQVRTIDLCDEGRVKLGHGQGHLAFSRYCASAW